MPVDILNGVIVDNPTRLDDMIRVSVPDAATMPRNTYGPMTFRPVIGGDGTIRLPQSGDFAIIGVDQYRGVPWVIEWHRIDHADPPYDIGVTTIIRNNWNWSTSTTTAATRSVAIDAATWQAANKVRISELRGDGTDATNLLAMVQTGDGIYLQDAADSTKWARYTITGAGVDQGTYREFPVSLVDYAGTPPANNRDTSVLVVRGGSTSGGGGSVNLAYTHIQGTPSATWNVMHNLGYHPNVTPVDSLDRAFLADVTYVDNSNLTITMTAATAGKAYCS